MSNFKYKLSDLVDVGTASQMFELLYKVAKIPNALIDMEGNILTGAGWQPICTEFHRKNPDSELLCIESDTYIGEEIAAGKPHCIYECPLGLVDSSCPVIIAGHHVGNVFTGQMLHTPLTDEVRERFRGQAKKYGYNVQEYMKALEGVPVFPIEKHEEILSLLASVASQLADSGLAKLQALEQAKEIQESGERLRSITKSIPDFLVQCDRSGKITYVNRVYPGLTMEKIMSSSIFDFAQPDQHPVLNEALNNAFEDRVNTTFEFMMQGPEAEPRPLEVSVSPAFAGDGVVSAIFLARDISERKKYQHDLTVRDSKLAKYQEVAKLGTWDLDLINRELYWAEETYRLFDTVPGEYKPSFDKFAEFVHPKDFEKMKTAFNKALASDDDPYHVEIRIVNQTGREWVMEAFGEVERDEEGVPLKIFGTAQDVTIRRNATDAFLESEKRFRRYFDLGLVGMATSSLDKGWLEFNDKLHNMFGYSREEMSQLTWAELTYPDDLAADVEQFNRVVAGEIDGYSLEKRFFHKDGSVFHAEMSTGAIRNADNSIDYFVALFSDISERKMVEQDRLNFEKQIRHSQKLESLGVLAGGIAHDFNNILMGILGYADLALDELSHTSPAREFLQGILNSSQKASGLVKQMLAYSGRGQFLLQSINLNQVIEETIQMLNVSISKKAEIKFNYSPVPVFLEGDPSQISQIIMNLTINASEAIGDGNGVISISTGAMHCDRQFIEETGFEAHLSAENRLPQGKYAFLEVSDTGSGMSKDTLDRIFEPFFTTKFTGRGLGLSAILGIVRGHKGMIKIKSEESSGTTFKVLFPLTEATEGRPGNILSSESFTDKWQAQGTFLIADDEEDILAIGKQMLQKLGYDVLTADDGNKAIEVFKKHSEKIVGMLLDLTMPHKDGFEVFQEVHKLNPSIKVILTSGFNEKEATREFVGKGLAGFIQKPYVYAELETKIKEAMVKDL